MPLGIWGFLLLQASGFLIRHRGGCRMHLELMWCDVRRGCLRASRLLRVNSGTFERHTWKFLGCLRGFFLVLLFFSCLFPEKEFGKWETWDCNLRKGQGWKKKKLRDGKLGAEVWPRKLWQQLEEEDKKQLMLTWWGRQKDLAKLVKIRNPVKWNPPPWKDKAKILNVI